MNEKKNNTEDKDKKQDEKYCPECCRPIKREAVICPFCGVQVKKLVTKTDISTIGTEPKIKERPTVFTKLILIFESCLFVFSLFFLAIGLKVFLGLFLMGSFLFFLVLTFITLFKKDLRTTLWLPIMFIPFTLYHLLFLLL